MCSITCPSHVPSSRRVKNPPLIPSEQRCSTSVGIISLRRPGKFGMALEGVSSSGPRSIVHLMQGRWAYRFGPISARRSRTRMTGAIEFSSVAETDRRRGCPAAPDGRVPAPRAPSVRRRAEARAGWPASGLSAAVEVLAGDHARAWGTFLCAIPIEHFLRQTQRYGNVQRRAASGQRLQRDVERLLTHRAHLQDGKPEDVPLVVHLFHYLIVVRRPEVARLLFKDNFEVVAFSVVPDFQMSPRFGHSVTPFLIRFVRYAVSTNGFFSRTFTTTQRYLPPAIVRK